MWPSENSVGVYSRKHIYNEDPTAIRDADLGFFPTAATKQGVASGCHLDFLDDPYTLSAVVLLELNPEGYSGADLTLPQLRIRIVNQPGDVVLFPASVFRHMTWDDDQGSNLDNRQAITFFHGQRDNVLGRTRGKHSMPPSYAAPSDAGPSVRQGQASSARSARPGRFRKRRCFGC